MNTLDPPLQKIAIDGLTLAFRESGTLGKPVMILLHGLAETSAFFWRPLIAFFGDDYHIFAFDLLGHGDSDKPDEGYGTHRQTWLIKQAVESLGITPAVYVGHSMGGIFSTYMAVRWPEHVSRLILYDTPLPDSPRKNLKMIVRYAPLKRSLMFMPLILPFILRLIYVSIPFFRTTMRLALITWRIPYHTHLLNHEYMAEAERHSPYALFENAQSVVLKTNLIKELQRLNVPTLIIVGDNDLMVPVVEARQYVNLIHNAELVVVPNAGHVSLLDNPEVFNSAVKSFLEKTS